MESNDFFKCWFEGFEKGLGKIVPEERETILKECAEACSCSYPLRVYREAFAKSSGIEDFLQNLRSGFPGFSYSISEDHKTVTIIYNNCACDLFTSGLVKTGLICDCSRLSLKYNWEAVLGAGKVDVSIKQSILRGQSSCIFDVHIK